MTKPIENQRRPDQGDGTFLNPLFGGDYPDPSIIRVGETFYCTHSSFVYHPGLLIWQSRDLVNWQPVTFAADQVGWDIWAPELVHHEDRFYIYYFARNTRGPWDGKNWVVWADAMEGPWSQPIPLPCGHIDPGHVVGPDGKRYLHLSGGHMTALIDDGLALAEEGTEPRKVYDGWKFSPDRWVVEGFCLEGPKFLQKDGWYYLLSAEGGTAGPATSHMVVASRSKTPWGPWEHSPYNPIIHTESRDERFWSRGHGTLIETPDGDWWIIYHGYEKNYHTLGRQTLLEPVEWTGDGWFRIRKDSHPEEPISLPIVDSASPEHYMPLSDDFSGPQLGMQWRRFDCFDRNRLKLANGQLHFEGAGDVREGSEPLLVTPVDLAYSVEVEVDPAGLSDGSVAGLVLYYNPECFCGIYVSNRGAIHISRRAGIPANGDEEVPPGKPLQLRLVNDHHEVSFWWSLDNGKSWQRHWTGLDVSGYHHNVFGAFLSLRPGMMVVGHGYAVFRHFAYSAGNPGEQP